MFSLFLFSPHSMIPTFTYLPKLIRSIKPMKFASSSGESNLRGNTTGSDLSLNSASCNESRNKSIDFSFIWKRRLVTLDVVAKKVQYLNNSVVFSNKFSTGLDFV